MNEEEVTPLSPESCVDVVVTNSDNQSSALTNGFQFVSAPGSSTDTLPGQPISFRM